MKIHLNSDQIGELLQSTADTKEDQAANRKHQEDARAHLRNCASCQSRMRAHKEAMEQLASLQPNAPAVRSPQCPPDHVWMAVAAGIASQDSKNYLSHAVDCDHCGPLLHQASADFTEGLTAEEETRIAGLRSSTSEWQGTLAARLGSAVVLERKKRIPQWIGKPPRLAAFLSPRRLAFTAALAAVVLFGAWLVFHLGDRQSPEQLIANAYAEKRSLEFRIEGAPYVPLRQERGSNSEQNRMSRPALLKAEAEIAQKLQSHPDDVRWLQASGRASLLEDDAPGSEAAIAALEKARRLAPNDASVSVDLASSYILRGQFIKRPEDFGAAVEILGKVLSSHHDDETAQFNYAIALEKTLLKSQAVEAWRAFLSHFPQSAWAGEAQDHLASLQQQIGEQRRWSEEPLKTPEQLAAAFGRGESKEISQIDERIEEYQDLAVQRWLPQLFTAGATTGTSRMNIETALEGLAQLLSERHNDLWLQDFMNADRHSATVNEAVRLLGDSVLKIETSDESEAQRDATKAFSLFQRSHVPAGELRSKLVLILVEQFEHRDWPCEAMAQTIRRQPSLQRYAWIQIQVQLEDSLCANVTDKQALQAVRSASEVADAHYFPTLHLRAASVQSALYSALGDTHQAWSAAAEGLETFWIGAYPKLRGYNALVALDEVNYPQNNWFLEAAILKEAMPMVDGDPRTTMVAVEEARLGQTLMQTGDFDGAEKSYRQTELLLNRSVPGMQREALGAEAELGFAKVDLKRGRLSAAVELLERIRPTFLQIPDDLLLLDFYQTSGIAQLRSNHPDDAEKDLNAAIRLAEKGLRLVDTEDDRWKWSRQNEPIYRALVELKLHGDPRQALLDWEWYKGAALRDRDGATSQESFSPKWPLTPEEETVAIPDMDEGSALVSFVLYPQGYAVWVWDQTSVKEKWVPLAENDLSSLVMRFKEDCSNPRSDPSSLHKQGAVLYQKLFLPVEPWIVGRRHLVVEPDGVLKALPIGLLVNSDGGYLGDHFAISVSPGTLYLNRSRKWTGISAASTALVLGDPKVPGWMPLPDAEQEARVVAALFDHSRLFLQEDSSSTDLAQEIAQAEVFHFSGHAQSSVESAGLVIGTYRNLDAVQLDAISNGRSQLAVLSACSTSRGSVGQFDDDDSMVRRLMGARVPEVVASRWMVDSTSTAMLMKGFYSELLAGKQVSEALESAMRSVRARSEFSHPYYWAGFSVFGRS